LLTGITHPTGAITTYEYDDTPVKRFMSSRSVSEAYRVKKRSDHILLTNGIKEYYNEKEIKYIGDMGSSPQETVNYTTTIDNKQTQKTFEIRKKYIDEVTSPVFYTDQVTESEVLYIDEVTKRKVKFSKISKFEYDESKNNIWPIKTTTYNVRGNEPPTKSVITSREYNEFGRVMSEENPLGTSSDLYELNNITLSDNYFTNASFQLLVPTQVSETKFKNDDTKDQTILTRFIYEKFVASGNIQKQVTSITSNDLLLSKNEATFNLLGNISEYVEYNKKTDGTIIPFRKQTFNYHPSYNNAYIQSISEEVTKADSSKSTISKSFDYYKDTGQLKEYTDGNGYKTKYEFDHQDRITKVTYVDPARAENLSPWMSFVYYDQKNEMEITDEVGTVIKQVWNPLGWKTEEQIKENSVFKTKSQFNYDSFGRVKSQINVRGNTNTFAYDAWNRPTVTFGADYQKGSDTQPERGGKIT
jgi:hypothetical protein